MTFLEAMAVILAAIIPIFLSLPFVARNFMWKDTLASGVRTILWSFCALALLPLAGLLLGIPIALMGILMLMASILWAFAEHTVVFRREFIWHAMVITIPMLFGIAVFAVPFFTIHDGLPTGDIQKSILWAQEILQTNRLPDYQRAIPLLNRDPVDFYTPGLHGLTALIMAFSPAPLTSMGIFAIATAVCVAWIASAIAREVIPKKSSILLPVLAGIFTVTQYRFLRYLREPGYHFQNLLGELFLFGMIYLVLRFMRTREKQDAILFIFCGAALFFSHQFSVFIAFFAISAMAIAFLILARRSIVRAVQAYSGIAIAICAASAITLLFGYSLGLAEKIPAIFTTTPHLASLLPNISDYPATMGETWFYAGVLGIILLLIERKKNASEKRTAILFGSATVAILLLSQGPLIGIDIPPVRALFYLALPLSVGTAYIAHALLIGVIRTASGKARVLAMAVLVSAILFGIGSAPYRSYASLSHTVRTNSTLTAEQMYLIEALRSDREGGILVDDYNRRSASWLVLSGRPMFTRIAADLQRQMEESTQSKLRYELYEHQLDYEKIIELGSLSLIADIAKRNNISAITGIANSSSTAFAHNSALSAKESAGDIIMYELNGRTDTACTSPECLFLLQRATLANDIGDEMDTFEHLQASVRSARLSEPKASGNTTYRTTTAPVIPLKFNVGDYVRAIWDPEKSGSISYDMQFMLFLARPVEGLALAGMGDKTITIPTQSHSIVEVPQELLAMDEKGFITLFIFNPRRQELPIDLIALGPEL